jgi:hypothetical protein
LVSCAGTIVASHQRCWASRQTVTDPAHVATGAVLRTAYQGRTAATRGPVAAAGAVVGLRALSDYDEIFALTAPAHPPATAGSRAQLRVPR